MKRWSRVKRRNLLRALEWDRLHHEAAAAFVEWAFKHNWPLPAGHFTLERPIRIYWPLDRAEGR
jgi:hypothetical protein